MPVIDSCSWHGFSVADAEPADAVSPTSSIVSVSLRTEAINIDARHYTQDKYHDPGTKSQGAAKYRKLIWQCGGMKLVEVTGSKRNLIVVCKQATHSSALTASGSIARAAQLKKNG
ncbi:hypothetical protein MSG28_007785 [Choristoneura fumiferana]|uniref:Uncharacterized protein n=1 Tax=Choristoneura fumiferana TaxID=7141 RepID=A0ACC0JYR7_CHOFU|nr:hypothetical protein MSG28_007785 [Choristoneura fumiferana]